MCNNLTILAHTGQHRAIAQCEHGALHINWGITTLRLRPQDFLTLARFLDCCCHQANKPTISEGWCQFSRDQHGTARLWLGQAGLALAADDVTPFLSLVDEAATLLRAARPASSQQPGILHCPILTADLAAIGHN